MTSTHAFHGYPFLEREDYTVCYTHYYSSYGYCEKHKLETSPLFREGDEGLSTGALLAPLFVETGVRRYSCLAETIATYNINRSLRKTGSRLGIDAES